MSARTKKFRYQLLGLVFLVIVALFFSVTVASYKKAFTPVVHVTMNVASIGSQLGTGAEVKARGVLVGEVRSISVKDGHAVLGMALQPGTIDRLPRNVSAILLPKTLFGERYVSLEIPEHPASDHLAEGDVIPQDRSKSAIQIQKVLTDLMPVLQAVQPEKLSQTLGAISQALHGRGKQLGETLVHVNSYLQRMNPSLPDLNADISDLAAVSDSYADAAPELLNAMSEFTTTTKTVVDQRHRLAGLFSTLTRTSVDLKNFLSVNKNNLIDLVGTAGPTLDVLRRYSPEYPCLFRQFAAQVDNENQVFGKGTDHPHAGDFVISVTASRGRYIPGKDDPDYTDDRGPRCYHDKGKPWRFPQYPPNGGPVKDGSTHPVGPERKDENSLLSFLDGATTTSAQSAGTTGSGVAQVANSPQERKLVGALLGPQLGVMPAKVPGWGSLLAGPMYRGSKVRVK